VTRHGQTAVWRDGNSDAAWPSMWPTRASDWPTATPRERWIPDRDAASVVCLRTDIPAEVVTFDSIAEAAEAVEELYAGPCGPQCARHHVVVWAVAGQGSYVVTGRHDPPAVPADLVPRCGPPVTAG
jgi:hypothetical protein